MKPLYRIIFDNNRGTNEWGYPLDLSRSRKELSAIPGGPRNGMRVIIYEPDDFELEAYLHFEEEFGYWKAIPIPGTTKYYR